jgi:DNA-binding NarL/FixJ family response regulator
MGRKLTLMMVEDAEVIQDRLRILLEKTPVVYKVYSAGNYEEAEKILYNEWIDLAILDINLPGKSGIEVLRYIKTNYPQTHVIMLTNEVNPLYRNLCLKLGADYFFDKSSDFDKIPLIIPNL